MGEFNPPIRECITLREAEEYAGCDRETIRRMIVHGEVPAVRFGQMWVTTRDALDKAFEKRVEGWLNVHRRMERGAKIRADWRCQRCGVSHGRGLQALSIYYRDRDESNQTAENMIVLCYECRFFAEKTYHPDQMLLPGMELPEWIR
jgi:excisionase family DNA binding protein